jgi:hypothetical protein
MSAIIEITQTQTAFDAVHEAARYVSKDPTRPALNYINIEKSETEGNRVIVATNGRALFMADVETDIDCGLWKVIKSLKKSVLIQNMDFENMTYPNWNQVMPDESPYSERLGIFPVDDSLAIVHGCARLGVYIDPQYTPETFDGVMAVHVFGDCFPVLVHTGIGKLIIMPIRQNFCGKGWELEQAVIESVKNNLEACKVA